jgi:single-stranded-DNA-specific exonuclease
MDKALDLFMSHVEKGSNIGIVVDSDVDGVTSASALHNYIVTYFDNEVKLSIHRKKVHGIFINELEEDGLLGWCDLLIVPDAGTNDAKQAKELVKKYGMDILCLDHHQSTTDNPHVTLVNNHVSNVALDFTGATMVYKFLQGLDDRIGESASDDYLDLIAVGMIGDMANTTNPEVQLLIRKGLTNVCNPMFESIIEKQSFSIKGKINQMTFSFNIIPLINAATRVGEYEDMKTIVEAFCGINPSREFEYEPSRGKNKGELIIETLYEYTARLLVSIKGKQDRAVKKVLEGSKRPPQVGLYDILDGKTSDKKMLLIDATDYIEEGGLSGLLANKIRYRYNRPTLVVTRNEKGNYRGSGRGEQIEMFRSKLEKSKHIKFAQGHEPAFGFMLKTKKPDIQKIELELNKMFKNEDTNAEYIVDFSMGADYIEDYMIEELCQLEDYWGNGIDKPVFHIHDIVVSAESIDTGKEESKFSFTHNDIEFILFKPSPEKMSELVDWSDTMCYNLIGEPSINEFDGRRIVQIIISAIERVKLESDEETSGVSGDDWDNSNDDWDAPQQEVEEVKVTKPTNKQNKKEEVEDDFEW